MCRSAFRISFFSFRARSQLCIRVWRVRLRFLKRARAAQPAPQLDCRSGDQVSFRCALNFRFSVGMWTDRGFPFRFAHRRAMCVSSARKRAWLPWGASALLLKGSPTFAERNHRVCFPTRQSPRLLQEAHRGYAHSSRLAPSVC